jgi:alpha-tubulin suppressor-like RCC1 family protein
MTAASEGKQATTLLTAMRLVLTTVAAGVHYTCGVATKGVAFCWGANEQGQLGNGLTTDAFVPSAVWGGLSFTTVSVQYAGGCGLTADGSAFCWGSAGEPTPSGGALGGGSSGPIPPLPIAGGLRFTAISDADGQACALTASGAAYCWGWNRYGQLGTGDTTDRSQPALVTGGLTFTAISAGGDDHTCGLTSGGAAYCWGLNNSGQVGAATSVTCSGFPCSLTPMPVSGGLTFAGISAGGGHTCGLTVRGAVYCWGAGSTTPAALSGGLSFAAISNTCGLTTGGAAYCWGAGSTTPVAVPGGLNFATISAGGDHTCGLTTGGVAYCWGSNGHGQLGDGTQNPNSVPVKVFGQP